MDGDQLGSVRERRFDLNFMDHFRDAIHDILSFQDRGPEAHQVTNRSAVTGAFEDLVGNDRNGFRIVQLKSTGLASPREVSCDDNEKLLLFAGR